MEVVSHGDLIRHGQSRGREDFFLFDGLFLFLFQQLLLFHALSTDQNLLEASADIVKFEMGTCDRACVFLITFFFCIDSLVICEVDIVNVIVVVSHFSVFNYF